ncbi:MAG: ABC transporter permease [Anaerolineales bacterium]
MNTWLVLRQEIINTVTRRSFLLTAFGIPLFSALIFAAVSLINRSAPGAVSEIMNPVQPSVGVPEGFVDNSGLIEIIPENITKDDLRRYPDVESARLALIHGEISGFYVIPEDYLEQGQIQFTSGEINPMDAFNRGSIIDKVLQLNLLEGDSHLAAMVTNPFALQVMILNPSTRLNEETPLAFFIPYIVMLLYYMLILMSAGFLVSSINKERESRVMEIILVTITPRELLSGKFIGLGLIGLLVNLLWVGTAYILLVVSGTTFQVPADFQIAPHILLWGLVYFLLGYAVYGSLMGAVGALVPNLRETSQATMVVILPMIIPLMFVSLLIQQPDGLLAIGLSLFPLTSPVTMMLRLSITSVPVWQLFLSVVLLLLTAVVILRVVARMFQAQSMLSGQPMSMKYIVQLMLGRV